MSTLSFRLRFQPGIVFFQEPNVHQAAGLSVAYPLESDVEGLSRKNLRSALSTLDPAAGGIILALGSLGKAWDLQDREADAIEERMKRVLEANAPPCSPFTAAAPFPPPPWPWPAGEIPKG